MSPQEYRLIEVIKNQSVANNWDDAVQEWDLIGIELGDGNENCICGKKNIVQVCNVRNRLNKRTVIVGSSCVKKFLDVTIKQLFDCAKRMHKDIESAPNAKLIKFSYEQGWIDGWEREFSLSTFRKRNLSGKQMQIRVKINKKVLSRIG